MKRIIISWVIALMTVLAFMIAAQAGTYTSDFSQYLSDNESKDQVSAIITMADRVDLEALKAELYARKADRQEWHEAVVRALQDKATESQANVLAKLDELKKQGAVSNYTNLWLGNLIIVTATQDAYDELVQRVDVDQIAPNYEIESIKDMESNTPVITSGVESGLSAIHADECWAMGYTGEGRLVSSLDTGVEADHEALSVRWRGHDLRYANDPEWAWYDPVTNTDYPFDSGYHGTHTMGTICGLGESEGDTIGVAFGAEWISAGVIDRISVSRTVSDALTAFEWIADPDGDPSTVWDVPDVCSNSWGVATSNGYNPCDETFWEAIDYAEAAGVVLVFAAGNNGSTSETISRPADRATTSVNCFSIGAIDGNDEDFPIASFSSRGPSYCTEDGSTAIKPEIVAPGVDVNSAYANGGYITMSGTSMATPHVAGVVALIRQANPNLTSDQVKQIILDTADDLGNEGDDNDYGKGIINAYAAIQLALSYLNGMGVLTGTVTNEATGEPLDGATITVPDRNLSAVSDENGLYYLNLPPDTLYNIKIDYSSDYLLLYDQQSVSANETTYVNYALEPKIATTFTVSFANGDDVSYRNFYLKGSWDSDGYYDADWSADLMTLADDGQLPDETAGDGIFTVQKLLVRDADNTYSWKIYTENYGVNDLDDAFLADGSDFNITGLDPIDVPTLEPNPSGSDNNFVFSIEGDNGLLLDMEPGINGAAYKWGVSTTLTANITYTFTFHVMHGDSPVYGSGGVGGTALTYTPTVDGDYDIIFNDNSDSYLIGPAGTEGAPLYPCATSGKDGHVPLAWLTPGTYSDVELAYDDGTLNNSSYFYSSNNMFAVMFAPESYPVAIDSVMIHVCTEGDVYWPWPNGAHDPTGVSIFLDDGTGNPEEDPVFYTEATAELGEWLKTDAGQIVITSGYFWVAMSYVDGYGYDGLGFDAQTDYPANQWYREGGVWYNGSLYEGDIMIRAKVLSSEASTWVAYDDPTPATEIGIKLNGGNRNNEAVAASTTGPVYNTQYRITDGSGQISKSLMAYHPQIIANLPVTTETEIVSGYNLYRGTTSNPYDQGLKINSDMLTDITYDDWGTDVYGPIVNGTTYYYQVTALYNVGGSYVEVGPSTEFTGTPVNIAPDVPENLTGETNGYTVTLNWDANIEYDIASYNIYRCVYGDNDYVLVGSVDHPTATFSEEITTDGTYSYRVAAVDAGNMESEFSNIVSLNIGLNSPGAIRASDDLEFQVDLEWRAPGNSTPFDDNDSLSVAVLYGDYTGDEAQIMNYMINGGLVTNYGSFYADCYTPDLSEIQDYDLVIIWSSYPFYDNEAISDLLVDYVDLGKAVLALNFSFIHDNYGSNLTGQFIDDYSPMGLSYNGCAFSSVNLGDYDENSPIMEGINSLGEYYWGEVTIENSGEAVAYWSSGYPAVAISYDYRIACINGYVGSTDRMWTGDMLQLVYNTVSYLANGVGIAPDNYNIYRSNSEDGEFTLLANVAGDATEYSDTTVANGVPYYYKVTAVYGDDESEPTSTIEGQAVNYAPEKPADLAYTVDDLTANLTWSFTDSIGDLDHFNIYRKLYSESSYTLIGNSTANSYADVLSEDESNLYGYCVSTVDNGDPQLESDLAHSTYVSIGNIPPQSFTAVSNRDGVVPLSWYRPGVMPCTTLVYDDGVMASRWGLGSHEGIMRLAKEFTGVAPITVCSLFVYLYTEDSTSSHYPSVVKIWDDGGSGTPGSVLAETTLTSETGGAWLTVGFPTAITCNTDNFWVSWGWAEGNSYHDYVGCDAVENYPGTNWLCTSSNNWQNLPYRYDLMIRASITIDGVAETLTENNPVSQSVSSQTTDSGTPVISDTEEMLGYYIYRSTSPDVPIDDTYRITPSYITETTYNDEDVTNGTTYYYVATAIYNVDGEIVSSLPSDEVSAMPAAPGQFAVDPTSITASAEPGDTAFYVPLTLTNSGGLPVTFSISTSIESQVITASSGGYYVIGEYTVYSEDIDKSNFTPEETNPPVVTGSGGPDSYGYTWVDSDDENGPTYNWIDISGIGEEIADFSDDANVGPFDMQFSFPFYGNYFSAFRVCSNGFLSFTSTSSAAYNYDLPHTAEPYNLIAPFWDDLDPESGGEFYYWTNNVDTLVMSWIDVPTYDDGNALTFQIILTKSGVITLQYGDLQDNGYSATIGIQNGDGSDGLSIAYNSSSYIHDNMAIRIKGGWLGIDTPAGTIPAGESMTINAMLDPSTLTSGDYTGTITFSAYDVNHSLDPVTVPVTFTVNVVGIDDDVTTVLPTTYSLDQNYPNPFNAHTEIKYALPVDSDVQLEIYNVLGQKVTTLINEKQTAGYHSLIWDGTNESGQVVSSGMYLYKLVTSEDTFIKKMVMLK